MNFSSPTAEWKQAAVKALTGGDYRQSIQFLEKVIAAEPSAQVYNQLGAAHGALKEFARAEECFAQAVALDPRSAEARYNLAVVERRHRKLDAAAANLREAARLKPSFLPARIDLADVLAKQGKGDEALTGAMAIAIEQLAVSERRKLARVQSRLGDGLVKAGRHADAEHIFRRCNEATPNVAETLARLASSLASQDRHEEAVVEFQKAIELRPEFPEALVNLGASLKKLDRNTEAEDCYRKALAVRPEFAEAHCNLAALLLATDRCEEAIGHCRQALAIKPDFTEATANQAGALVGLGKIDEARECYEHVLLLRPDDAETCSNLGLLEMAEGNIERALSHFDEGVRIRPNDGTAHSARAMAWLSLGDFERGWSAYEWRFRCKEFGPGAPKWPRWSGEDLTGRSILLWSEQGLGDTLQFIRYATLLKERGARVLVECPPPLERILRNCKAIDLLYARGGMRPVFDVYAPLMSLPGIVGSTVDDIPTPIPYLQADDKLVEKWGKRLEEDRRGRLRIGICWRGHPKNKGDAKRSFALSHLEPLARLPGVELISLQKHVGVDELESIRDKFRVRELPDLDEDSGPFMDTAAVLKQLDLLISCDSSVAHLAGALGVPVWLALPYAAEWRWLRERADSPWYPSHRLFRQSRVGGWESVFGEIARELGQFKELDSWQASAADP